MRQRMSGSAGRSVWSIPAVVILVVASACSDSGSDGVGPSAVATGGSDARITLEAPVADRSGTCPAIRFRLGSLIVETTSSTDFETPCAQIANGAGIEAHVLSFTCQALQRL